jgi:hypothetical protein
VGDMKSTIQTLVRANEIYIAYMLATRYLPQAVPEVALLFSGRAEKFFQADICMDILKKNSDKYHMDLVKRRLMNRGLYKKDNEDECQMHVAQA